MYALFAPPAGRRGGASRSARRRSRKRSIKKATKVAGLKLAVAMMDLTTLEGKDTAGKVRQLCQKALRPLDSDPSIGPCAAICVYPNHVADREGGPRRLDREGRERRHGVPERAVAARHQARRRAPRRRLRRRRDRHGHRSRRDARRRLREGLRRDRRDEGGLRRRPPQGDPRDRRARHLRRRPQGERARDRRRRRLHQDVDRQDPAGGDAAGDARDARGDPRPLLRDRAAASA